MYLLNLDKHAGRTHGNIFTFHYVSIKSPVDVASEIESLYLHSTMYLLNQHGNKHKCKVQFLFTFHYVSIKSLSGDNLTQMVQDLHSTMYLLNPCGWQDHILYQIYIPLCIY